MNRFAVLTLIALCLACALHAGDDEVPLSDAEIQTLILKMKSEDFDIREHATVLLSQHIKEAEKALAAELEHAADPEFRNRLERLIPGGKVVWTFEAGYLFGTPVVKDHRVYVANKDENFFCLDADGGSVIWSTPMSGLMFHAPAVADGKVITIRTRKNGRKDGTVFCLDAKTGREIWQFRGRDSQTFTAPAIDNGRLYFTCEELLLCLNLADGSKIWEYSADDLLLGAPTVAGGNVYVGGLDQQLVCVDAATGKRRWSFQTDGPVYAGAVASGDRVYTASQDCCAYALNARDGSLVWKFKTGGRINGTPSLCGGKLYFGTDAGAFHCLAAVDGHELWNMDTGGVIYGPSAVAGGRVYFGSINNKLTLYCRDADSGRAAWTFQTAEAGYAWPVLAGSRLYVGYHSLFYALRTNRNAPADWPMMNFNPARTGAAE
jgi:outer membrane protein assembly factor BamB